MPKSNAAYPATHILGLTGNIGCGKSAVAELLAGLGAHVRDADQVTREVMAVGEPAYLAIVAAWGNAVLQSPGGPIDRPALGRIVFGDPTQLQRLEAIVHPATRQRIHQWLAALNAQASAEQRRIVAVVDAIKLIESGWTTLCNAVWVVRCDPAVQLRRLIESRGMHEADARQRIAAQPPQDEKIAVADVVIDNSGTLATTEVQVVAAWEKLGTRV